jgi:deazaflavin-dependent oxidoreductase (nitroreductase family)
LELKVPPNGTRGAEMPRVLRWLFRLGIPLMVSRYRRRGGDMRFAGQQLGLLTTKGAKSGERRQTLVGRFPDGDKADSWIVTATNGGARSHPAWFRNIAAHPDQVWLDILGVEVHVRPEMVEGPEHDEAYRRIVDAAPVFRDYPKKTDRNIPVIRLSAILQEQPQG